MNWTSSSFVAGMFASLALAGCGQRDSDAAPVNTTIVEGASEGAKAPRVEAVETQPKAENQAVPAEAALWSKGTALSGTCRVEVNGSSIMDGQCSGLGHGDSIFLTAERDGCSVELGKEGAQATGKLFAYRNTCWIDEAKGQSLEEEVVLPSSKFEDGCWRASGVEVCVARS
jgi:hypothetical protein